MRRRADLPAGQGPEPGLCGRCTHARVVVSDRGSRFHLCDLAATDPRFSRYPRLPVLRCAGFEAGGKRAAPADRGAP